MADRKVYSDSVTPLPDQPGPTPHGLMVNAAAPEDKTHQMTVLFSLALPADKQAALEAKVAAGETVSPEELKNDYTADKNDTTKLVSWLTAQGYKNIKVSPNGTGVYADATAGQIEQSLQVNMVRVTRDGITYTAAKDAPSLPSEVAGSVHAIIGLQPFRHPNKHRILPVNKRHNRLSVPRKPPAQAGAPSHGAAAAVAPSPNIDNAPPYLVSEILKAYHADGLGVTGNGQTIAILIDTFPADGDLTQFWAANNLPSNLGRIQKINVGGGQLPAIEGEETLDAEWTSGIAPGATIRIYASGSLDFVALDQALDAILNDLDSIPGLRQLSISLGLGETFMGGPQGEAATQHQKYLRFAAAGVNVFVSSGDAGSNPDNTGHSSTGPTQAEYAASDPAVVGVGGTSLNLAGDGSVASETGWTNGGGGKSIFFPRPVWQKGAGVPAGTQRLVPDASLTADPNFGALVVLNGSSQQIGGTSWSAPVWAGFCALINEARTKAGKPALPFLNPHLYPLLGSNAFRDITAGSNGAFNAGRGYDLVTGIGVPNVGALMAALLNI
ncbi:MAG TPA: S53 family peptidase [Puia sp.]|nr:S53 family peptidase [Puia sp.]